MTLETKFSILQINHSKYYLVEADLKNVLAFLIKLEFQRILSPYLQSQGIILGTNIKD